MCAPIHIFYIIFNSLDIVIIHLFLAILENCVDHVLPFLEMTVSLILVIVKGKIKTKGSNENYRHNKAPAITPTVFSLDIHLRTGYSIT